MSEQLTKQNRQNKMTISTKQTKYLIKNSTIKKMLDFPPLLVYDAVSSEFQHIG